MHVRLPAHHVQNDILNLQYLMPEIFLKNKQTASNPYKLACLLIQEMSSHESESCKSVKQ